MGSWYTLAIIFGGLILAWITWTLIKISKAELQKLLEEDKDNEIETEECSKTN